jgi:hypothetical protein
LVVSMLLGVFGMRNPQVYLIKANSGLHHGAGLI